MNKTVAVLALALAGLAGGAIADSHACGGAGYERVRY